MAPVRGLVNSCVGTETTRARTAELVDAEDERLQVREAADGRRDGACARARKFLCRH